MIEAGSLGHKGPKYVHRGSMRIRFLIALFSLFVAFSADGAYSLSDDLTLLDLDMQAENLPLVINEFMASNSSSYRDPQRQYDDWIEIYNSGNYPIDVGGMYLTDDLNEPVLWRIPDSYPAQTTIAPQGYLVIWADKDTSDGPLHADFELRAEGEQVGLFDSTGKLIDSVVFGAQTTDISFGRYPDSTDNWRALNVPTPGAENQGAYLGLVADTKFDPDRGFFTQAFYVEITCATEGATIIYTLDGSKPTAAYGEIYDGPILIETTTIVRAMAFKPDWLQTNVDTHSYIFLEDVIHQPAEIPGYPNPWTWLGGKSYAYHDYEMDPEVVSDPAYSGMIIDSLKAIPTLSIATDKENLDMFYWGSGESVASMELIYPNQPEKNVQAECGVQPHSHNRMKRSLRLNFRASYGDAKLKSDIFRDAPLNGDTATDTINKIVLRGGNNRSWARIWNPERTAYTMDQWYRDTQNAMSSVGSRGTFVHLYINGLYWGLYNPVERPDASFAASYMGGQDEDWYSVSHGGSHGGDASRWNYLKNTLVNKNMADQANYMEMQHYLDIEKYIDYVILTWFVGMTDWPGNNWWGANRNDIPGPFMYFGWDAEWSWLTTRGHNNGWVHPDFRSNKSGGRTIAAIWHCLRYNSDFMMLFADRVYKHLFNDGVLTDENCVARYLILNDFIRDAVVAESARWGDACESVGHPTRTRDVDWVFAENEMIGAGFMADNAAKFILALKNQGYYPNVVPPSFSPHGGHVAADFELEMTNPNSSGTIYYTLDGSDLRIAATQQQTGITLIAESDTKKVLTPTGFIEDYWKGSRPYDDSSWSVSTGLVEPSVIEYTQPVRLTKSCNVKTRIFRNGTWSPLNEAIFSVGPVADNIRITEIMYHPLNTGNPNDPNTEFLELKNIGNEMLNLNLVGFTGCVAITGQSRCYFLADML
jgi:hypothetical protein